MADRYEVVWVEQDARADAYSRITRIGIRFASYSVKMIIAYIEAGNWGFFVRRGDCEYDIIVATRPTGHKYLKSTADADIPGTLLVLPDMWEYHDSDPGTPWSSDRSKPGVNTETA